MDEKDVGDSTSKNPLRSEVRAELKGFLEIFADGDLGMLLTNSILTLMKKR